MVGVWISLVVLSVLFVMFIIYCAYEWNKSNKYENNIINKEEVEQYVEKNHRSEGTKKWKMVGVSILVCALIFGIFAGIVFREKKLVYKSSISEEYDEYEEKFNYDMMLSFWDFGFTASISFFAIYSICHRLDLLIDKK